MAGGRRERVWVTEGTATAGASAQRTVDERIRERVCSEQRTWDRAVRPLRSENRRRRVGEGEQET